MYLDVYQYYLPMNGGLSEQFQQALTYAAKTIDAAAKNSEDTKTANKTFSVTGHSLGGLCVTHGINFH
jgi:hypothetical protein